MNIDEIIEAYNLSDLIVNIRRSIHQNPELSEEEFETGKCICRLLNGWDIEYEDCIATTGIVAIVRGEHPGKTIALRADMDALPIDEETKLSFASQKKGIMHACGHDAHVAMLLVTCRVLSLMKGQLEGNVKFFFQPAEETVGGAKRMIQDGCMDNPKVDVVLGLHVEPSYETGKVGIKYSKMYAASDIIDITIKGKGAHGAHPNEGIDTIAIAANIINGVNTVISRKISPLNSAVCTFGVIKGGTVRNQIADCTILEGIIRTLDQETRVDVREKIKSICNGICLAMGAEVDFHITESYAPLINNDSITDIVKDNAEELLGKSNVIIEKHPDLSCEDFSYFAIERPACYFHLGCYDEGSGLKVDLHHPKFTIDEKCMLIGVELQVMNVLSMIGVGKTNEK